MVALLLICYSLNQLFKLSANIAIPVYQQQFSLSSGMSGLISSAFFVSYAIMQVASGPLCKKLGPGKLVGTGMAVAGIGILSMAFVKNPFTVVFARFLMGLGLGTIFVSVFYQLSLSFSGKAYVTASSVALGFSSLGSASAAAPLKAMTDHFGLSTTFIIMSVLCFVISAALFMCSRNFVATEFKWKDIIGSLKKAASKTFKSIDLLWGMSVWVLFCAVQITYSGLWCTKWTAFSFPGKPGFSGVTGTVYSIAVMIGSFFGNYVKTEKMNYRQSTKFNSIFFVAGIIGICIGNRFGNIVLCIISNITAGFFCGSICLHDNAFCKQVTSADESATILGIWNFAASILNTLFQWGTGTLIDSFASLPNPYSATYLIMAAVYSVIFLF